MRRTVTSVIVAAVAAAGFTLAGGAAQAAPEDKPAVVKIVKVKPGGISTNAIDWH